MAIITVPVKGGSAGAEECGQKGNQSVEVSSLPASVKWGRHDLEDELINIAHRYGMCVLGPNIVGTLSNSDRLNASFAPFCPSRARPP